MASFHGLERAFQSSLRDLSRVGSRPGIEMPGYFRSALRAGLLEDTVLLRASADWIGLSALGNSLCVEPGASAPGWYKVGPLAL